MPQSQDFSAPVIRPESGTPLSLPLDVIDDNPYQPRVTYDAEKLAELSASICSDGLLQPVVVRRGERGRFQLIAGHRRLRAFRALRDRSDAHEEQRWANIPALLKESATEEEMARLALNENMQRDDLLPTEAAAALARYREMAGLKTSKDLAKATGLNENRVKRLLRLHELPPFIKDAVAAGLVVDAADDSAVDAAPRRSRRRLDLMAALEFGRLYRVLFAREPKKADTRVRAAIERALREDWPFRRIERAVEEQLSTDSAEPSPSDASEEPDEAPAAFEVRGKELRIQTEQLSLLPPAKRLELLELLLGLVNQLRDGP